MKRIPSPKSLPVVGTMPSILAAGGPSKLHLYVDKRHKELGPIYRERIGPVSGVFIADANYMRKIFALEGKYPKHIVPESWLLYNKMYNCERGLLFMDGEQWLHFRKKMNNLMLKVTGDKYSFTSKLVAENLIEKWKKEDVIKDLEKQMYEWSLEAITAVLLGPENYLKQKSVLHPSINKLSRTTHQIFKESATLSLLPVKLVAKLNFPVWKRFVEAASSAVEQGKKIVEELLDLDEQNLNEEKGLLSQLCTIMNKDDLKKIVIDLILAAGDTTAHTMQWLLYLLSKNEATQTRIYNELQLSKEQEITRCPLLKGSLKETLRLYPVAPFITRFMPEDAILDGFQIKANELVLLSLYSSGRNEKYFSNPNVFLPERWSRCGVNYERVFNPTASLPFAMGSRSCIGKKIAETQILITLSMILSNFKVTTQKKNDIEMVLHLISVPSEPVQLVLKPRKKTE